MSNARYFVMKKLSTFLLALVLLTSCTQYAKVQKSMDYDYKYELAKAYYMEGEYSLDEAKRLCALDDYHLAKRQMTWFKRDKEIVWLPLDKIKPAVLKCIQDG